MDELTLTQIDKVRQEGFRPDVVGCVLNDKKILLLYKAEYKLWLFPQGGIKNNETPQTALHREMSEELGEEFIAQCQKPYSYLGDDKMEFTPDKYDMDELFLDSGDKVKMIGKAYLFYILNSQTQNLDIAKTEFDEYFWLEYHSAGFLVSKIYQSGRRRIMTKVLNLLKDKGLIN